MRRVPADLPLFGALLFGLSLMAFGWTGMYAEYAVGRPSSTASLGFLFVPIWGGLAALVGLVLGALVRAVWRSATDSEEPDRRTRVLLAALGCAVVASAAAGAFSVIRYEQGAKPGTRFDSGLLVREFRADSGRAVRASTRLHDSDDQSAEISWTGNNSQLLVARDRVVLRDTLTGKRAEFSIAALDYVTRADAVSVAAEPGRALLAIVITGRATGRRAIAALVDENYQVIFEELIHRCWAFGDAAVEIRAAADEYVVVGPGCAESLILRRKHPGQ